RRASGSQGRAGSRDQQTAARLLRLPRTFHTRHNCRAPRAPARGLPVPATAKGSRSGFWPPRVPVSSAGPPTARAAWAGLLPGYPWKNSLFGTELFSGREDSDYLTLPLRLQRILPGSVGRARVRPILLPILLASSAAELSAYCCENKNSSGNRKPHWVFCLS